MIPFERIDNMMKFKRKGHFILMDRNARENNGSLSREHMLKAIEGQEKLIQRDCVAISKTSLIGVFVIPGLTRNPVHFRRVALLDAGSSPA